MKKTFGSIALSLLVLSLGFWGCQRSVIPSAPPPNPAPTSTASGPCTNSFGFTCTLTPNLTVNATATGTATSTTTTTATPSLTPTLTASLTPTATATSSPTPSITLTASGPCTNSFGFTCTLTPILTVSPSRTPTSTASPTPSVTPASGCVTLGHYDPTPGPTISLTSNTYSANLYPAAGACGASFNQAHVYVMNLNSSPASVEMAVYDNGNLVGSTVFMAPSSSSGWLSSSLVPLSFSCGDTVVLAVQNLGPGVQLAMTSSGSCASEMAGQSGPMPSTYPDGAFLTSPGTGPCYEFALDSCGTVTPTATSTPTVTPTTTP